jgi:L-amino acid N-acyltransferase YncA
MTACIRLATPNDAAALARIYRPAVVERPTSFELEPPDAAEMARRVEKIAGKLPWLVYEHDGAVLGYAYASQHRERAAYQWSVDVSAYVSVEAHRGGVGRALYTRLFELLVRQQFRNAYAGITLPNPPSEGFHRAMGFVDVGIYHHVGYKLGRWHDVLWLERALQALVADPPSPLPLAAVISTG